MCQQDKVRPMSFLNSNPEKGHQIPISAEMQCLAPSILSPYSFEANGGKNTANRRNPQAKAQIASGQPSDDTTLPSA